ncbi:MAG TPA: heme-copper oxidase subunit III [Opitutaceae bacterium]|jgi:cytochrome o ubiquinol oxidase subunit 3|nr:heme-copper oxidase subunit III [Opitutaceae bacterium]
MSSTATATIDHHHDPSTTTGIPNKKLLMWTFLASDCMFFGCLISTHLIYRLHPPPGNPSPREIFNPPLTSFSTFILLMSSLLMALAVNAIQRGNVRSMRHMLLGTIFFGCIFLTCQVYEFTDFVMVKHMTITNCILGSTFFTLTGTHGCHVAIGVLWLVLMYIRSFQPADVSTNRLWFGRTLLHIAGFIAAIGLTMYLVLDFVHMAQDGTLSGYVRKDALAIAGAIIAYIGLNLLSRTRGAVDFGEANAIDVESMGLYWHFVDIVWIVIFTVVYLLEYI